MVLNVPILSSISSFAEDLATNTNLPAFTAVNSYVVAPALLLILLSYVFSTPLTVIVLFSDLTTFVFPSGTYIVKSPNTAGSVAVNSFPTSGTTKDKDGVDS